MENKTKKDFKESFGIFTIVALSMLFVAGVNRKCSDVIQKGISAKVEKMESEKKQIVKLQKLR